MRGAGSDGVLPLKSGVLRAASTSITDNAPRIHEEIVKKRKSVLKSGLVMGGSGDRIRNGPGSISQSAVAKLDVDVPSNPNGKTNNE